MGALRAEKIRFQLIGMSAAVLHGVPVMTLDIDIWLDLPRRQYVRVLNLARSLGATVVRNTVVELMDGTLINFIYEVTGLGKFSTELKKAKMMDFHGKKIPVMALESIRKSKQAIRRPKDLVHLEYIAQTVEALKTRKSK